MTPKIIELKQVPVVLVELPDTSCSVNFPDGCIILGLLSNLTEEQFSKCVEVTEYFDSYVHPSPIPAYKNYLVDNTYGWLAKDSFYSLLEYEKVYTENPYGIERPPNTPIDSIPYTENKGYVHFRNQHPNVPPNDTSLSYESFILKWQEAQSRTIDPKRTVVLLRKEKTK